MLAKQFLRASFLLATDFADLVSHTLEIITTVVCELATELTKTLAHLLFTGDDAGSWELLGDCDSEHVLFFTNIIVTPLNEVRRLQKKNSNLRCHDMQVV